jgi:hypothetical protein
LLTARQALFVAATTNRADRNVPTLFYYAGGEVKGSIVGIATLGGVKGLSEQCESREAGGGGCAGAEGVCACRVADGGAVARSVARV